MKTIPVVIHEEERYVSSKDLYNVLELNLGNYAANLKAWFSKEYLFQGKKEFSLPVKFYDYILITEQKPAHLPLGPVALSDLLSSNGYSYPTRSELSSKKKPSEDYLIRLEFAKLIALDSSSRFKKQFVQWLLSLDAKLENNQLLSRSTLLGLMEMVKLCTYIDNQLTYYKNHKATFFELKEEDDSWNEFDLWRNRVLKLLNDAELTEQYIKIKGVKPSKHMTKIEKYAILDTLESIRASLFDFLVPQVNNISKAKDLSSFVKELFQQAGVTQFDIKPKGYSPNGQLDLFRGIQEIDVRLVSQTLKELSSGA